MTLPALTLLGLEPSRSSSPPCSRPAPSPRSCSAPGLIMALMLLAVIAILVALVAVPVLIVRAILSRIRRRRTAARDSHARRPAVPVRSLGARPIARRPR